MYFFFLNINCKNVFLKVYDGLEKMIDNICLYCIINLLCFIYVMNVLILLIVVIVYMYEDYFNYVCIFIWFFLCNIKIN